MEGIQGMDRDAVERKLIRYKYLIYKLSSKFASRFSMPLEEMREVAEWTLIREFSTRWSEFFDPALSKEFSFVYQCIYWSLMTHCQTEAATRKLLCADMEDQVARKEPLVELLKDLGEDAQFLVKTVTTDIPNELLQDLSIKTCSRAREGLKKHLAKIGWTARRVSRAWAEVTECL